MTDPPPSATIASTDSDAIRAVAANDSGAQLVGIDTRRIYMITFAIGTAFISYIVFFASLAFSYLLCP